MTPTESARSRSFRVAGVALAGAAVLAGGAFAFTGAVFTDQKVISGNSVTAASLKIGAPGSTDTIGAKVAFEKLLPGQTADAQQVLHFVNAGDVPFQYTVTIANLTPGSDAPAQLPGWVPVTVSNGTVQESGTLADPPTLRVGSTAVGAEQKISVTTGLDTDADNSAQGKSLTFDVVVTASQLPMN